MKTKFIKIHYFIQKMNLRKLVVLTSLLFCLLVVAGFARPVIHNLFYDSDFLKKLRSKFEAFFNTLPEDRVYLQFDKTLYNPGETVWFSAWVRNGSDLKKSAKSGILTVQWIDPKGTVAKEIRLIAKNGHAAGDFQIGEEDAGGMYKVRAFTNWQKNDGDSIWFEKDIQVQKFVLPTLKMKIKLMKEAYGAGDEVIAKFDVSTNENKFLQNTEINFQVNLDGEKFLGKKNRTDDSGQCFVKFRLPEKLKNNDGILNIMLDYQGKTESISRSVPITLGNIKLEFFPEGGDLVMGLKSRIAFRALNEFDKPADIDAAVFDQKGNKIADFSSFYDGMGAFEFTPGQAANYYVKITRPAGIDYTYELPAALYYGYTLSVDNSNKNKLSLRICVTRGEELNLVAQIRGKIYFTHAFKAEAGENTVEIPVTDFPAGVAQITLFDSKGVERAERLAFVNKDKQLHISISTDKEKYQPREKVKMNLKVTDENGLPTTASLAVAVVNDQLLTFADDKSGNILSQLLLEQDINQKVDKPYFYFDKKEAKADKALDYLLMTAGWRRFAWEQILGDAVPTINYTGEIAVVKGQILDSYTYKPVSKAKIKINDKATYEADEQGNFIFNNLDLSETVKIKIKHPDYTEAEYDITSYGEGQTFYLYPEYTYMKVRGVNKRVKFEVPVVVDIAEDAPMIMEERLIQVEDMVGNEIIKEGDFDEGEKILKRVEPVNQENLNKEVLDDGKINPEIIVADFDDVQFARRDKRKEKADEIIALPTYYRARKFAAPVYKANEKVEQRSDFRSTIFWDGLVEIDKSGTKTIEFYNSDDISSFKITAEGISTSGNVGREEKLYYTQLPFSMEVKLPQEIASNDYLTIPLTLKNNTANNLSGLLSVIAPKGFTLKNEIKPNVNIAANGYTVLYLDYFVENGEGKGEFKISFKSEGLGYAFVQKVTTFTQGYPFVVNISGQEMEKEYTIDVKSPVSGSLNGVFTAYPSVVGDILSGITSILQEPYGCFEQTSTTSYPNLLVMDYLKTTDSKDEKVYAYAENLLDKGYKRLTGYETPQKGYEWFGGAPAHEALTAYGLMQFIDMESVYKVDKAMIDRTANWLMSRRDGKGGFQRSAQALDQFGSASAEVTNAYIVWALSEANFKDIDTEIEAAYKTANESNDAYPLALVCNALYKRGDKRADALMKKIYEKQSADGSFTGSTMSITCSGGQSLSIETTALSILAMLKSGKPEMSRLNNAINYLVKSRSGYGMFGSTQGTILALKALTEYAKFSKKTDEAGTIQIEIDGKIVAEKKYEAGENKPITIDSLQNYLSEGKHKIKIRYVGVKNPLPYSCALRWNTNSPDNAKDCKVQLSVKLAEKSVKVGQTMRLSTTVTNTTNGGLPMVVAVVGIPSGMSAQPWQLKEIQEKKQVDYYEVKGTRVIFYFRQMKPSEIKIINLDLKAEIPGNFTAPASTAYLYYTNELKSWDEAGKVEISK